MRTVLVPLDGSPLAERALGPAVHIARRTGARLEIVAVNEPRAVLHEAAGAPGAVAVRRDVDTRLGEALRRYADDVQRRLAGEEALQVETRVLEGPAASTLAAYAQATGPDLLVVASHGRSGARPLWLGSVTDALARLTASSLLVVPTHERAAPDKGAIRRVLLALDGTRGTESVIAVATALLGHRDMTYVLMHAVQPLHPLVRAVAGDEEYERDLARQRRTVETYLSEISAGLRVRGSQVVQDVQVDPHRANAVLSSAAEHEVDLIALATHARGPLGRLLLGSVADKVLRGSPVPVLLCVRGAEDGAVEPSRSAPPTP
ncbi:MAG TPA: universal stress protein [Gemmatimonadaceae bacterium]|nr:universal stress protein [Gemmatimonadaceae bacterium]